MDEARTTPSDVERSSGRKRRDIPTVTTAEPTANARRRNLAEAAGSQNSERRVTVLHPASGMVIAGRWFANHQTA